MPTFEEEPRPDDQQPRIDTDGVDGRMRKEPDVTPPESDSPGMEPLITPEPSFENLYHIEPLKEKESDHILPNFHLYYDIPREPLRLEPDLSKSYLSSKLLKNIMETFEKETLPSMGGAFEIKPPAEEKKPEKTGPTLEDIGGYDDAKDNVRKFLAAAQHPEKFREWGAKPPKGLLLYGPPGTGKTMFAKAIATELDGHFEAISPADINSKWFGESEERIKKLFEDARKRDGHTVIFIDEIESMLPQRDAQSSGGVKDSIMTMFLQYMDGKDSPDNVTIVGATNRLDAIDSAVLRPGRFDRKIEIGYPDPEARAAILDIHIAAKEEAAGRKLFDLDKDGLDRLLKGADVLTGAQIAEVVRRTCEAKAYEALEKGEAELVSVDDLVGSFASLIAESARYDS